jgi:hypothetical protein
MDIGSIVAWIQLSLWVVALSGIAIAYIRKLRSGETNVPSILSSPRLLWTILVVGLLVSCGSLLFNYRPRVIRVERIVEKPVDRVVEKIVQADCPKPTRAKLPANKTKSTTSAPPQQPETQFCEGGNCAQTSGQTGGITAGQINLGPPPMKIKFSTESVTSTKPEFSYETKVIISTSVNYTPVSLAIICDVALAPSVSFDFGPNGATLLGVSSGLALEDNKVAWVKFGGTAVSEDYPLYVHVWSKEPLHVLKVVPARVKQQP